MSLHTLIHRASLPGPALSETQAQRLLAEHYGLDARVQALGLSLIHI